MTSIEINNKKIITDLLYEWGKTNMLTPNFDSYLNELKSNFEYLKEKQKHDLPGIILEITSELQGQVESSIDKLSDPEIIVASDEDDIWYEAEEHFHSFDKVNFLKESLYILLSENERKNINETLQILNNIDDKIITWLHYSENSPLMLTLLNEIRNAYLKEIPEEKKYEFPWYDTFSEYSENTINTIIENFNIILKMKDNIQIDEEKIPEEIREHINEIYFELKRDKNLMSVIHREYVLYKSLLSTVNKRNALRLLHIIEDIALEYKVTEIVEKIGIVRVAKKIIEDFIEEFTAKKDINESEKVYLWFMGAVCGPQLEDVQRLELLEKVESSINTIDISEAWGKPREILNLLKRWYNGDNNITEQLVINRSFEYWINYLNSEAQSMSEMESDEDPSTLWNTLIDLPVKEPAEPATVEIYLEKLISFINNLGEIGTISTQPSIGAISRSHMGEENTGRTTIKSNKNPIYLSIIPNQYGEYLLPTSPDHPENLIIQCDAENDYKNLWEDIGRVDDIFWDGGLITEDGIFERVGEEMIRDRKFHSVKVNKYQGAVIGISNDTEQLKKFIETIGEMKEVTDDLSLDNVIVLIFNFKTRKKK